MSKIIEYVYDRLPYDVFLDRDIEQLMPEKSNDSRYGLIKRALKNNEILRMRRGLYCLSKKYQRHPFHHFSIAQLIYGPSYVSLESALSYFQWIPEGVFMTTSVSLQRSIFYKTPLGEFIYHRVPQNQFYANVQHVVSQDGSFFIASPWKALCDYVYILKKEWTSIHPLVHDLRIEEESFSQATSDEFDQLIQNYRSVRVRKFIQGVRKDLGL